jgi:hypothetical protein
MRVSHRNAAPGDSDSNNHQWASLMFVQLQKEFMGRKVGERIDVSDSDGNLLVKDGVATPVHDDLITPAVQRAMEQAFGGFQKGLDAVIQTALKQFADAQTRSRRHAVPAIFGEHGDGDPKRACATTAAPPLS